MSDQTMCAQSKDASKPRVRCAKCLWKKGVDPNDIPGGYSAEKHAALKETISDRFCPGGLRMMACHETPVGAEQPCVGWLANQLQNNNIGLRLAVMHGHVDANFKLVGEQHGRFEDTLPKAQPRKKESGR